MENINKPIPVTQKVAIYKEFGELSKILQIVESHPVPQPGPEQVLMQVGATAINPADWKLGSGKLGIMSPTLPMIPCYDYSGTIVACGSSASKFKVGDEVYGFGDALLGGGCAEYVTVDEVYLQLKPKHASFVEAAAFPLVVATAIQGLKDKGNVKSGEKMFVNGGSTAVGAVVIQLGKLWGLSVTTTYSSRSEEFVKTLNPDLMINYTEKKWEVELQSKGYNIIFDCIGDAWAKGRGILLQNNTSRVVTINTPPTSSDSFLGLVEWAGNAAAGRLLSYFNTDNPDYIFFFTDPLNYETRKYMMELFEGSKINVPIDSTYELDNVKEGFAKSISGRAQGKIVFTPFKMTQVVI